MKCLWLVHVSNNVLRVVILTVCHLFAADHHGKSIAGCRKRRARRGGGSCGCGVVDVRRLLVVDQLVELICQLVTDGDTQLAHAVPAAVYTARA